MSRSSSSLFLDLGLLGTAALVASVSVSLALEPLLEGDVTLTEAPLVAHEEATALPSFDPAARGRLAQLTALSLQPSVQITSTAPLSPLRYRVAGTLVSRNSVHAIAVLFDPQTRGGLIVRVGDLLEDAVVTAIETRRVVVHRFGRDEVIEPAGRATPDAAPQLATIRALSPDRVAVPRQIITAAMSTLPSIGRDAIFMPTFHSGGQTAFRIDRIRPGSLFDQLGLQNGDVVVSVDGIPVGRLDELIARYPQLARSPEIRVEFVRAGQIQRRTYAIEG